MKKLTALLAALCLLFSFAACRGNVSEPTTIPEETVESASDRTVSDTDAATTEPVSETTTAAAETTTAAPPEGIVRPTELVTYSEEGIPIANAYFSLMLPTAWDGRYRCATAYDGDVMTLTFKDKDCVEAGAGGVLFTLALVPAGASFEMEKPEKLHTLKGASDTYTLYVCYPQEEQTTPETAAGYAAMQQQIGDTLKTLIPGAGYQF